MRTLILCAFLLASVFSGCLAEPSNTQSATDAASPSTSDNSGTSTTSPSAGNATVAAENTAPTANLTSDLPNGTAPLNVTFTVAGQDADGDELSWTLDVDSDGSAEYNGTVLPESVVHEFTAEGNYTAVLNVTDGVAFASSNITIVVEADAAFVPKEDAWAVWDELGQCHAKGAIELPADHYLHERGDPPGTGYAAGDGTWIYEEGNGVEGLQIGGAGESAAYTECVNPDILIF